MATTNEITTVFNSLNAKEVHLYNLGAGQKILKGTIGISVNGVVYVPGSQFSQYLSAPGADGNGGLLVWTPQANVRYSQLTGGVNKTLGVSVSYGVNVIDVIVQLATDGAGVSTSTANAVVAAVSAHATAATLVRLLPTGSGNGLASAFAAAAVPVVFIAGVALNTYDNSASPSAINGFDMSFHKGDSIMLATLSSDAPTSAMIGSKMAVIDNITVRATVTFGDLTVLLSDITPGPSSKTFFEIV